ncbi:hypothetical protein V2A60_005686 [Cordyceps javanica]
MPKHPTPPMQTSQYLKTSDSGISMWSPSEETVAYPGSTSPSYDLTKRINTELFEDLERNGAAKSALEAIFGPKTDEHLATLQTSGPLSEASAISQSIAQRSDNVLSVPQFLPQFEKISNVPLPTTRPDSRDSTIPIFTALRPDNASSMPDSVARRDSNASNCQLFPKQQAHSASDISRTIAQLDKASEMSKSTLQLGTNVAATSRMTSPQQEHSTAGSFSGSSLNDSASAARRFVGQPDASMPQSTVFQSNDSYTTPPTMTRLDATIPHYTSHESYHGNIAPQSTAQLATVPPATMTYPYGNAAAIPESNLQQDRRVTTAKQIGPQQKNNAPLPQLQQDDHALLTPQTAKQTDNTIANTQPLARAQLDDNGSVASCISRTSSPDCELDGGAQLGRSETAFSLVETHFSRPECPHPSKLPLPTAIDMPITTLEQKHQQKSNGAVPSLRPGPGQGLATAPLLAELNPDIHFDSSLWPDATRRFMTGAKS